MNICKGFIEYQRGFLRFLVIIFLCTLIVISFTDQKALSLPDSNPVLSAESGVGGGAYLGESPKLPTDDTMETGLMEPELFSKPRTLLYDSYTVVQGDVISELAANFGLNQDTIISINNIKNARLVQIGQVLRIPNQDGIMYTVGRGDTLDAIARKYKSEVSEIKIANELFADSINPGLALFIPGAQLDWVERQEINGDLFIWPVSGRITSPYGYRRSPFTNARQFHSGLDISASTGTPVRAAMSGRVSVVGYDDVLGNYVVVSHHSGYRTLYGHLSRARVRSGAYVGTGERIGDVGNTGMSTGPHLHFSVFKNGVSVNPRNLLR